MADDTAPNACTSVTSAGTGSALLSTGSVASVIGGLEDQPTLLSTSPSAIIGEEGGAAIIPIGVSCGTGQGPCPEIPDPEEEVAQAKRVDFITDTLLYRGEADPGKLDSESAWRIRRITIGPDDDVTEEWADGSANYNKVWDNRLGYTYS